MVGVGVGYAMSGGKILIEMMYSDFIGCAGDEIINQAAKWQSISFGRLSVPVILHIPVGFDYGAQHSQDLSSVTASVPGLKVVYPVTPHGAKSIMAEALKENNPVVLFESKRLRCKKEAAVKNGRDNEKAPYKIGIPETVKTGKDLTVLSVGATLYRALDAAKTLEEKYGVSAEIIDAVGLVPFDYAPVIKSVEKTGKILIVSDAAERGSFMNEFAQKIALLAFSHLKKPPVTLGAKNHIVPAYEYDSYHFPQEESIIQTVNDFLIPLGLQKKKEEKDIYDAARRGL